MRSEQEVNRAIDLYADTVRRICILYLKNSFDTEDIFQEVFLKYALSTTAFENEMHEKAWIIRVAINKCKDVMKSFFRSRTVSIEEVISLPIEQDNKSYKVLEEVLSLPQKYKNVVYLHYFEGYSAIEIGKILHKNVNTVYTLLSRARKILQEKLGDEEDER
jgi:RNA polymerase sigma factor (sigma-70 family)